MQREILITPRPPHKPKPKVPPLAVEDRDRQQKQQEATKKRAREAGKLMSE